MTLYMDDISKFYTLLIVFETTWVGGEVKWFNADWYCILVIYITVCQLILVYEQDDLWFEFTTWRVLARYTTNSDVLEIGNSPVYFHGVMFTIV